MNRHTACTLDCPDSCSLRLQPGDPVKTRGNPEHPFTAGFCCKKGVRRIARLSSPERITRPMLRRENGFEPVSWDTALEICAERIQALRATPERILHARGHGYRGAVAAASLAFFARLGASGLRGSLCDDAGIEACLRDCGSLDHNAPEELLEAKTIVNWGRDLSRSSLHVASLVKRAGKNGCRVLTVSPGGDDNARYSDGFVPLAPGTDRFLAAAVISLLLARGAVLPGIKEAASNWQAFQEAIRARSVDEWLARCGVSRQDAARIADAYQHGPTATIIAWGMQRHLYGGENVRLVNALALCSGQFGINGGGSYFNISSGRNLNTTWAEVSGERRSLLLPRLARELAAADPPVEMIWVDGLNPVNQVPEAAAMAEAYEACPFTVCVDAFFNDTALRSNLVLPPALGPEREDVLGSALTDYVNHCAKVLDPPGECRSDLDILRDLGARLDPPIQLPDSEEILRASLDVPELDADLSRLRREGFARANRPRLAYRELRFDHPDGRFRFAEAIHDEPGLPKEYPLRLLTLVNRDYIHSQMPEEEQQGLPEVRVSRETVSECGLDLSRPARLVTPLGAITVQVAADETLWPGVVQARRGGWMHCGRGFNRLIEARVTDMGETAAFYAQGCRLEQP